MLSPRDLEAFMQHAHHGARRFTPAILREFMAPRSDPQAVSTLHVSDGLNERVICLIGDGIRLLSLGERRGLDLPSHLLESGKVTVESLHAALETVRTSNCGLRQALLERNLLASEDYDAAVYKLIRDEILDLVFWEDAFSCSYPAPPAPEVFSQERGALTATVDFARLSEDVGRWIEGWGRYKLVLFSDNALIAVTGHGRRAGRSGGEKLKRLLQACAEGKNLRGAWRALGADLPELCAQLLDFKEKRWISVVPLNVPQSAEQLRDGIAAIEEALPRVLAKELVHEKLATLFEKTRLHEKAIEHLSILACAALERGEWQAACDRLRRILLLDRLNLPAFQALLKIFFEKGKYAEVSQLSLEYAQALEAEKGSEGMDAVAAMILKFPGSKLLADEIQAGWFALKGETHRAVSAYQNLAGEFEEGGDPQRAIGLLGKALACDPENAALRQHLSALSSERAARLSGKKQAESRESRKGRRLPWSAAAACLAAAVIVAVVCWLIFVKKPASATAAYETKQAVVESGAAVQAPYSKPAEPEPPDPVLQESGAENVEKQTAQRAGEAPPARLRPPRVLQPPSRDVGSRLCFHDGKHRLVTRPAGDNLKVTFGDGCDLTLADIDSERVLFQLQGREDCRWSISLGARTICRWQPGRPALIYYRANASSTTTRWSIPPGVEAVAISDKLLALRERSVTCVFEHDGALLRCDNLPLWGEGLVAEDFLVLIPASQDYREGSGAWVFDAATLELLWSSMPVEHWRKPPAARK